jgi:hypothetical protein
MEDEEVWIGDGAALLGPGPELTVTLAAPAYFARIACRFALLAATMSSTGGGEGCKSRSMSASTAECGGFVLLSAGDTFSDKIFEDAGTGVGELVLRGDISPSSRSSSIGSGDLLLTLFWGGLLEGR